MQDVAITREGPVWVPSANRVSEATMTKFRAFASEGALIPLSDTPALHAWSLSDPARSGKRSGTTSAWLAKRASATG